MMSGQFLSGQDEDFQDVVTVFDGPDATGPVLIVTIEGDFARVDLHGHKPIWMFDHRCDV